MKWNDGIDNLTTALLLVYKQVISRTKNNENDRLFLFDGPILL